MYEGIDDIDVMENEYGFNDTANTQTLSNAEQNLDDSETDEFLDTTESNEGSGEEEQGEESFISALLKSRGIEDPSKIKFENDNGEIEELDWESLDNQAKLNILDSSNRDIEEDLDASEIALLNAIRGSQLTPEEYIQYLQRVSVETYLQNVQNQQSVYTVDQYSDDELYVMDLLSKTEDITEEEAIEALERAKVNQALFNKQMGALRNEYKKVEEESIQYARIQQEQEAQEQFNQFAEQIENSIINFKEFSGCELNMNSDDMQDLYTFITGFDNAGNSYFSKALNHPDTIVKMAWFVLNGEKMIQDINEYYQKEITNVRKESYSKGLKDAAKKDTSSVTYKPKNKSNFNRTTEDDLDNF